ncbi:MAG: M20/M25/M40 family metallo-hydrolase [Euryarchaeota archaeon]|nr:M20/M25/M40 family metallo-hydrolase [Euryarchaeota archaeon]
MLGRTVLIAGVLLCSLCTVIQVNAQPSQHFSTTPSTSTIQMIQQVNESLLFYYLDHLTSFGPRYTGSESCTNASQYIYDEFKAIGLSVEFHDWKIAGFTSRNVVATLPGKDTTNNATYLITGHYDTIPTSPGADDDGSGAAGVLAIAKIMSQYTFNHTICFIAFSGEEVGSYGSFSYAKDAYRRGDNIIASFDADMIGYANTTEGGSYIRFSYPERSQWVSETAITVSNRYHPFTNMSIEALPNYIGSDHQAFVDYGYDAVWIAHPDGYPWGHSQNDTIEHINWTYYVKATKLLLAVLAEFANTPITLQVIITAPMEGYFYLSDNPLFHLDLGKAWYKGLRGTTILFGKNTARANVVANDPIKYVVFCIDGNFQFSWPSAPPYECSLEGIHYPFLGKHTLKVYAYTTTGEVATDEMDIHIYQPDFRRSSLFS